MAEPAVITPAHARRLALRAQGLDGSFRPGRGAAGAAAVVERLGYVQIDTIAVVERAHEHVLWTRQPTYRPEYLHRLLARDRRVFEYWTHAASYVPMADYRYYVPRMRALAASSRRVQWCRDNPGVAERVLERIRAEGPLAAADFDEVEGRRGPWWDWKPAKIALEALFNTGELMIAERRNFQRVYDLAERVLPAGVDTQPPDGAERARWAVGRTLDNLGVVDASQVRHWHGDAAQVRDAMAALAGAGQLVHVSVRGDGDPLYARATDLAATARGRARRRVHLLSPFDNLVIRRRWLRRFFAFDYTIECYLPAPRRKHGYFCLPVLCGDCFVGRLDAKAERGAGVLAARSLAFEPDVDGWDELLPALAQTLAAFARFNGCQTVRLDSVRPGKVKAPLRRALTHVAA